MPGFVSWVLGIVFWVLGLVCWVLGLVCWVLGLVCWVLGYFFLIEKYIEDARQDAAGGQCQPSH